MKTAKIINSAINGIYKKNPDRWMLQEDGEIYTNTSTCGLSYDDIVRYNVGFEL